MHLKTKHWHDRNKQATWRTRPYSWTVWCQATWSYCAVTRCGAIWWKGMKDWGASSMMPLNFLLHPRHQGGTEITACSAPLQVNGSVWRDRNHRDEGWPRQPLGLLPVSQTTGERYAGSTFGPVMPGRPSTTVSRLQVCYMFIECSHCVLSATAMSHFHRLLILVCRLSQCPLWVYVFNSSIEPCMLIICELLLVFYGDSLLDFCLPIEFFLE